jgi:hypothetical protein
MPSSGTTSVILTSKTEILKVKDFDIQITNIHINGELNSIILFNSDYNIRMEFPMAMYYPVTINLILEYVIPKIKNTPKYIRLQKLKEILDE